MTARDDTNIPATPLPIPAGIRAVILFGGTFDPPHSAHATLAARARDAAAPGAWLLYTPAARSPHKAASPESSPADRTAMIRLAIRNIPRAAVWTDEMDRAGAGPSFTIDTIRRLRGLLNARGDSEARIFLLMGADQAAAFHRWRDPRDILACATPIVMLRAPAESEDALLASIRSSAFWTPDEAVRWRTWIVSVPVVEASATGIREALAGGASAEWLPIDPEVLRYIRERRLYGP